MMVDAAFTTLPIPSCMDRLDAAHALLEVGPDDTHEQLDENQDPPVVTRSRSGSVGLDELAALAADMNPGPSAVWSASSSSSSDEDSEAMPPPPPRRGRLRSASNPEGMEKWDSLNKGPFNRMHFVLPSAILEEELAEANALAKAHEESYRSSLPLKKRGRAVEDDYGTSPNSVTSPIMSAAKADDSPEEGSFPDDTDVVPEELLRRARSRLLEDLSEGSLKGEKGVLTLPHSLSKYKEVYNQHGRIGIYTPAERAAIIARFHRKRSRRVWNKKIRYGCRKNLADRRMRVKGRFVKRSTESFAEITINDSASSPAPPESVEEKKTPEVDMPDVNDPEAGFCPTEKQPYRRTRRHTIT